MKKLILSSLCMLMGLTSMSAQNAVKLHRKAASARNPKKEILEVAHRTNNYFMTKYSDPTLDTFVKKVRTSNLWTRAVYYEGLMALYEIDPQQRYLDYTDKLGGLSQVDSPWQRERYRCRQPVLPANLYGPLCSDWRQKGFE